MADDPTFASLVRTDPVAALRGIGLTGDELLRLERIVDEITTPHATGEPS
jgi:hypothetical protein